MGRTRCLEGLKNKDQKVAWARTRRWLWEELERRGECYQNTLHKIHEVLIKYSKIIPIKKISEDSVPFVYICFFSVKFTFKGMENAEIFLYFHPILLYIYRTFHYESVQMKDFFPQKGLGEREMNELWSRIAIVWSEQSTITMLTF